MKNLLKEKWWTEHKLDIYYSICIMIAGTLLHFAYEWSGRNAFVALFSPVDESVWEHLKLFFVPAFFFSLFMYYVIGEKCPDYIWCQTKSILFGLLFIAAAYFVVAGITRRENMWVDIGIFYLAAILAGVIGRKCRKKLFAGNEEGKEKIYKGICIGNTGYAGIFLLILWSLFIWLTYCRPALLVEWLPGLF